MGFQAVEKLGHRVFGQALGDGMGGVVVTRRQAGTRMIQLFAQRLHLVIVKAIGKGTELDFSHGPYGAAAKAIRQRPPIHPVDIPASNGYGIVTCHDRAL